MDLRRGGEVKKRELTRTRRWERREAAKVASDAAKRHSAAEPLECDGLVLSAAGIWCASRRIAVGLAYSRSCSSCGCRYCVDCVLMASRSGDSLFQLGDWVMTGEDAGEPRCCRGNEHGWSAWMPNKDHATAPEMPWLVVTASTAGDLVQRLGGLAEAAQ